MIVVRLKGGLGNQIFQYAFAKATAHRLQSSFSIDCSLLLDRARGDAVYRDYDLDIFNLCPKFCVNPDFLRSIYKIKSASVGKLIRKIIQRKYPLLKEPHFHFEPDIAKKPLDQTLYDGWWQSPKYFENVKDGLREDLAFKMPIEESSKSLFSELGRTNSVCLNVRRTDFVGNSTLETTNLEYFKKAVDYIQTRITGARFYIFSDDLDWCAKHLLLSDSFKLVAHDHKGYKFSNYLKLMQTCKHYIIPNSTFAWWAVWLNACNDKIVIAPKNWFGSAKYKTVDLVPSRWIRM